MKKRFFVLFIFLLGLVLSACGQQVIKNANNWPVQDFTYSDQQEKPFGLKDLKGKVWVADFIFTKCVDVCSPMTFNMAKLQTMVKKEGIENIEFVSFSVDPTVDSPQVLEQFGKQFDVDFKNWHFLTGYPQTDINQFALESFKTLVDKPETGDQVIHGTSFYLVNKEGTIIKDYTGLQEIPFQEIIQDMKILTELKE